MKIAAVWKRMVALAIDVLIIVALYSLLIVFLNWSLQIPIEYSIFEGRGLSVKMNDYAEGNFVRLIVIYMLAKLSIILPYFIFSEGGRWQATVGKKILGIKVGNINGDKISFSKAFLRTFGKVISGQFLLIGYLMAFFTEKKQALHDFLAGTIVFEN